LLRNTWFEIRRRSSRPAASEATTLMAAIAAEQEIALDSADFRRGVSQWRRNLRALIERYTAAGIPVFVATVASNLSDQPPFISAPLADDVRAEAAARLAALSVVPLDADTAPPDPTPALARLEAIAAEQGSAELYFALGRAHERRGNDDDARRAFELAREHDLLRFRAPAAINAVVRELTRTTAARLVDVETVFVAAAPRGLVGDELMLEHLHPTVDGYFLLADAFYDALAAAAVPAPFPRVIDDAAARAELGIFAAEEYFARAAIAELQSDFPFAASPRAPLLPPVLSPSDALGRAWFAGEISWLELAEAARELVAAEPLARAVASQRIADALPFRPDLAERAAADWLAAGRPEAAARYAEAARYGSSGR
jgi:lysophospholipase L1-like esterase